MLFEFDHKPDLVARFRAVANSADPYTPGKRKRAELAALIGEGLDVEGLRNAVLFGGWAYIRNMPQDIELPHTPKMGERPKEKMSLVSEARLNGLSAVLGLHPVAFHNEKGGDLIHQIVPVPGYEASNSNRGSDPFPMHIEAPHHTTPPDVIALTHVRNYEGGATNFAVMADVMTNAPDDIVGVLREPEFRIRIGESFGHDREYVWPILEYDGLLPKYRVDLAEMQPVTDRAGRALDWLRRNVYAAEQRVVLGQGGTCGDTLLINNRLSVHGRVGFESHANPNHRRWLQRQYMTATPTAGSPVDNRWPHVWDGG